MSRFRILLATVGLGLAASAAGAQEQGAFPRWSPEPAAVSSSPLLPVGDSVRTRVGYHHWVGAAIGGGIGAVAGLLLGVAVRYSCSDCPSDPSLATTSLATAGLVGAFGFLVGLASPKYRWVVDSTAHSP